MNKSDIMAAIIIGVFMPWRFNQAVSYIIAKNEIQKNKE